MGVSITKIELTNYRQYRKVTIEFKRDINSHLYILKAKNGTGKTTFINAITWCLYGEEKYLDDSKNALNLPNEKTVENTNENGNVKVTVRISMKDDDTNQVIVITREHNYKVNFNIISKNRKTMFEQEKFNIAITNLTNNTNSRIIDNADECNQVVDTYFNRLIYDYYFFDGENLKNYFTKSKSETIQTSIFNISQVTLLENTKERTNNLAVNKSRELNRKKPSGTNYLEEKINLENEIKGRENANKKLESDINKYSEKKVKADEILNNYTPIKFQQQKKLDLEKSLKKNDEALVNLRNGQYSFIYDYMILLRFYPRIKKTYDMICYKEEHNELPPNINKKEIREIIDNHLENCPVCNSEIDDKAIKYLQDLLESTSVSTGTSHQSMKIKSSLETMISQVLNFEKEKKNLINTETLLKKERKEFEDELNEIHSYLSNYSTDSLEKDIAQAEKDSKYYDDKIQEARDSISQNIAYNKKDRDRLNDIEKKLKKEEEIKNAKDELSVQVALLRRITTEYTNIKQRIMLVVKDEIEKSTWRMFDAMTWKKNTFKSLSINDKYEISVLNMNNKEMIGSLSATEYMALAYSFTLAIHEASGKNCPLVIDSPLGRVSDENREKMATELLKVSKEKQIIMLFTPDEYSSEVKNVYEDTAASIIELCLSEDESEVEGVNNQYDK